VATTKQFNGMKKYTTRIFGLILNKKATALLFGILSMGLVFGQDYCNSISSFGLEIRGLSINRTLDGRLFVVGSIGTETPGSRDVYFAKYRNNGTLIYEGGTNPKDLKTDVAMQTVQAHGSGMVIVGYTGEVIGTANADVYVARIATNGTVIWQTNIDGGHQDYGYSIVRKGNSGYFVIGNSYESFGDKYVIDIYELDNGGTVIDRHSILSLQQRSFMTRDALKTNDGGYVLLSLESDSTQHPWDKAKNVSIGQRLILTKLNSSGVMAWNKAYSYSTVAFGDHQLNAFDMVEMANGDIVIASAMDFLPGTQMGATIRVDANGTVVKDALFTVDQNNFTSDIGTSSVARASNGFVIYGDRLDNGISTQYLALFNDSCEMQDASFFGEGEAYSMTRNGSINATFMLGGNNDQTTTHLKRKAGAAINCCESPIDFDYFNNNVSEETVLDMRYYRDYYTVSNPDSLVFFTSSPLDLCATRSMMASPVEQIADEQSFSVYPNPSSGTVNIELPKIEGVSTVSIVNSLGQLMLQREHYNNMLAIEAASLPAGIYWITVENGTFKETQRLVVR